MGDPWLGKPAPFHEVYPDIESICVEGKQFGDLRAGIPADFKYSASNVPATIPCANPRCQQGGYLLQTYLDAMAHSRQKEADLDWSCNGHEGSPKGRRTGAPCMNRVKFGVRIRYKQEEI